MKHDEWKKIHKYIDGRLYTFFDKKAIELLKQDENKIVDRKIHQIVEKIVAEKIDKQLKADIDLINKASVKIMRFALRYPAFAEELGIYVDGMPNLLYGSDTSGDSNPKDGNQG